MRRSGGSGQPMQIVVLAVVVVFASVAVAGGVFTSPTASTADRPLGADAADRYAAIDGLSATETTVVERGNATRRTVTDVRTRPGTDHRHAAVVAATDRKYELRVSNGSAMWLYDRDANAAKRLARSSAADGPTQGERLQRLFTQLNVTDPSASASASASPGVSPLPVVPSVSEQPADVDTATASEAAHGVSYEGTEPVDGRTAYVLRIEPHENATDAAYRQTVWVDAERFFPLQRQTEWTDDGEQVSLTTTYTNVTFDPGLADSTFRFDPPANATVETLDTPETTTYASVSALRADTDRSVPEPDLPPSFGLTYASRTTGRIDGVGLQYANATAQISVATYNRTRPVRGDRTVTVGDRTAELNLGPTSSVSWNCGEYRYTVRGEGVPPELLVEVARSVQCS